MKVSRAADKVRRICTRLLLEPRCSEQAATYIAELKAATRELAAEQMEWNKASQGDKHQEAARQSYRSREKDSADGFAEGLKLFSPRKPGSDKNKN